MQQEIQRPKIRQFKSFYIAFDDPFEVLFDARRSYFANQQRIEVVAQNDHAHVCRAGNRRQKRRANPPHRERDNSLCRAFLSDQPSPSASRYNEARPLSAESAASSFDMAALYAQLE